MLNARSDCSRSPLLRCQVVPEDMANPPPCLPDHCTSDEDPASDLSCILKTWLWTFPSSYRRHAGYAPETSSMHYAGRAAPRGLRPVYDGRITAASLAGAMFTLRNYPSPHHADISRIWPLEQLTSHLLPSYLLSKRPMAKKCPFHHGVASAHQRGRMHASESRSAFCLSDIPRVLFLSTLT
jgi:hypothetical protein